MNRESYKLTRLQYEKLDIGLRRMSASDDGRVFYISGQFEDEAICRGFKLFNAQGSVLRLYWPQDIGEQKSPADVRLTGSEFCVGEAKSLLEEILKDKLE